MTCDLGAVFELIGATSACAVCCVNSGNIGSSTDLNHTAGFHPTSSVLFEIEYAKLENYTGSAVCCFWGTKFTLLRIMVEWDEC